MCLSSRKFSLCCKYNFLCCCNQFNSSWQLYQRECRVDMNCVLQSSGVNFIATVTKSITLFTCKICVSAKTSFLHQAQARAHPKRILIKMVMCVDIYQLYLYSTCGNFKAIVNKQSNKSFTRQNVCTCQYIFSTFMHTRPKRTFIERWMCVGSRKFQLHPALI